MDYEKAYKAVLETATKWIEDGCTDKEKICLESVFPELRESEDERIRKFLIQHVSEWIGCIEHDLKISSKDIESEEELAMFKAGLAYLEKQKEQKPVEWSESDTLMCNAALELLRSHPNLMASYGVNKSSIIRWLQSFRPQKRGFIDDICSKAGISIPYLDGNQWCILKGDNIQSGVVGFGGTKEDALANFIKDVPIPQEWSKEDKKTIDDAYCWLCEYAGCSLLQKNPEKSSMLYEIANKLKFLRPQPKEEWNEEDDKVVKNIINYLSYDSTQAILTKEIDKWIDWLKSLRPSWKPSEEQLEALNYFIKLWGNSDDQLEYTKIFNTVESLRDALKKLM